MENQREILIEIFNTLVAKHSYRSRVRKKISEFETYTTFSFVNDDNLYEITERERIFYDAKMNYKSILNTEDLNIMLNLSKRIFVPADPNLLHAMSELGQKAIIQSLYKNKKD